MIRKCWNKFHRFGKIYLYIRKLLMNNFQQFFLGYRRKTSFSFPPAQHSPGKLNIYFTMVNYQTYIRLSSTACKLALSFWYDEVTSPDHLSCNSLVACLSTMHWKSRGINSQTCVQNLDFYKLSRPILERKCMQCIHLPSWFCTTLLLFKEPAFCIAIFNILKAFYSKSVNDKMIISHQWP